MTTDEAFEVALKAARAEIVQLLVERADIDARLTRLKDTVNALAEIVEKRPPDDALLAAREMVGMGISDAIRTILRATQLPGLSATEIRDQLRARGAKLDGYANEMSVIHNTLARLEKQGEIFTLNDGSWAPSAHMPAAPIPPPHLQADTAALVAVMNAAKKAREQK